MYSTNLVNTLNEIAHRYKDIIHASISSVLNQLKNTGAGAASLVVDVIDGDTSKAPQLIIKFDDHILILDKRKVQWSRLPDMKNMVAWAETKTSSFEGAQRLAWSTAIQKKKFDTWKPKTWRKKSLSRVLKEMNAMILEKFDEAIDKDFQQAVKV